MGRLCIVGLDCLTPQLAFEQFAHLMPTLNSLRHQGLWGTLESSVPPITVPAWACMTTGYPPQRLGIYGFRDRIVGSYNEKQFANCLTHFEPYLWDRLSDKGYESRILSVPLTWPARPLKGKIITGFLTPDDREYASYPRECLEDLEKLWGPLQFDVDGFRSGNHAEIVESCIALSNQQTQIFASWLKNEPWDFAMRVDMGPDRMHHALWGAMNGPQTHPFKNAMADYYALIDRQLKQVLEALGPDDTIMIVSDHGAQTMQGAVAINQWLINEGLLVLKQKPQKGQSLHPHDIDWEQTQAWGAGGYVGRVYLNVKDREPQGTIEPDQADAFIQDLLEKFSKLQTLEQQSIQFQSYVPKRDWPGAQGHPPDLILDIEDYGYRALGTIGYASAIQKENDLGEDGANHARHGLFVMHGPHTRHAQLENASLYDVAPTVCKYFNLEIPEDWSGKVLR